MYGEQNKTIVLRYYEELFERRRLAVIDEIFASGYVNHQIGIPGRTDEVRGPVLMVSIGGAMARFVFDLISSPKSPTRCSLLLFLP